MKTYAFFLVESSSQKSLLHGLGSDSYLVLDQRLTIDNQIKHAKSYMDNMNKNLNKGYVGFEIRRGSIRESSFVACYKNSEVCHLPISHE